MDTDKKLTTDILDSLKDCEPKEIDTDSITFEKYNLVMDEIFPIVQKFNVCIKECHTLMNKLEKKLRDPKEIYKFTLDLLNYASKITTGTQPCETHHKR